MLRNQLNSGLGTKSLVIIKYINQKWNINQLNAQFANHIKKI